MFAGTYDSDKKSPVWRHGHTPAGTAVKEREPVGNGSRSGVEVSR